MSPKLRSFLRFIIILCAVYALGYMVVNYYYRLGGVYDGEYNVVVVATWGRTWDLSPILALAVAGACGAYILNKE